MRWIYWLLLVGFFTFSLLRKAPQNKHLINQPAPLLKGIQVDQSSFSLEALKGKVVVLDVWATWCGPCRLELPMIERWAKSHPQLSRFEYDIDETKKKVSVNWLFQSEEEKNLSLEVVVRNYLHKNN